MCMNEIDCQNFFFCIKHGVIHDVMYCSECMLSDIGCKQKKDIINSFEGRNEND